LFRGGGGAGKVSNAVGKRQKKRIWSSNKSAGRVMEDTSSLWNQETDHLNPQNSNHEADIAAVANNRSRDDSTASPDTVQSSVQSSRGSSSVSSTNKMSRVADEAMHPRADGKTEAPVARRKLPEKLQQKPFEREEGQQHSIGGSENSFSTGQSISTGRNSHSAALSSTTDGGEDSISLVGESRGGAISSSTRRSKRHTSKPSMASSYTGLTTGNDEDQITRVTSRPDGGCTVITLEDDWFSWLLPGVFGPIPVPKAKAIEEEKAERHQSISQQRQRDLKHNINLAGTDRTTKSRRPLIVPHNSSQSFGRDDSILRTSSKHNKLTSKNQKATTALAASAPPMIGTREWQEILDATETMAMNYNKNGKKSRRKDAISHRQNHMYSNTSYTPDLVNELSHKLVDGNYHYDDDGDENDANVQVQEQKRRTMSAPLSPSAFSNTVAGMDFGSEDEGQEENIPDDVKLAIEKFRRHARALAVSPQDLMLAVRENDDNINTPAAAPPAADQSQSQKPRKHETSKRHQTQKDSSKAAIIKQPKSSSKLKSSSNHPAATFSTDNNEDDKLLDMLSFYSL